MKIQPHAPAALLPGKNSRADWIREWLAAEPVWTLWRRHNLLDSAGIRIQGHPACSAVTTLTELLIRIKYNCAIDGMLTACICVKSMLYCSYICPSSKWLDYTSKRPLAIPFRFLLVSYLPCTVTLTPIIWDARTVAKAFADSSRPPLCYC